MTEFIRILNADETPKCPPHHYYVDSFGNGKCIKPGCGATKVYKILSDKEIQAKQADSSKRGGKATRQAQKKKTAY